MHARSLVQREHRGEFPDPPTPFLSIACAATPPTRNLALGYGIAAPRADDGASLERIVGLHGGRLYYNLTSITLGLAPFGGRLAAAFNRFTGAQESEPAGGVPMAGWERALEAVRIVAATAWKYLWIQRRVARFESRVDAYAMATRPEALAGRDAAALARDLDGFLRIRLEQWNDAARADAAAMVCYAALGRSLARAAGRGDADACRTTCSRACRGRQAQFRPQSCGSFARSADAALADLFRPTTRGDRGALRALRWRAFGALRRLPSWGFRYSRELMLPAPRRGRTWRRDAILQSYLRDAPGA